MTGNLRVGIIGVGWGSLVQAPAFRAAEGYELAALCSRREAPLQAAGAKHGITDLSTDWADFVRRDDLDLISIASPVELHKDMTLAVIAAGKHVLCEKPAALTAADAKLMLDAAEAAGVAHGICFEGRWLPDRLAVWEAVRGGLVGKPYTMRIIQSASYWHPTHAPQSEWMYRRDAGGGYLAGLMSHDIDFTCALLGEVVAVAADVRTNIKRRTLADGREIAVDADDTSALLLRFACGASAVLSASVVGAHTQGARLDLFGEDGTLICESGGPGEARLLGGAARADGLTPLALSTREPRGGPVGSSSRSSVMVRAMALMLEDWRENFTDAENAIATLRAGWRVQRIIEAAHASAEGAGWVPLG
jgi:predicted dehydrogenase